MNTFYFVKVQWRGVNHPSNYSFSDYQEMNVFVKSALKDTPVYLEEYYIELLERGDGLRHARKEVMLARYEG